MEYIGNQASLDLSFLPVAPDPARVERFDALSRKLMRTMVITGMFSDLPEEAQKHEGVQAVMWRQLPEMDETMVELHAILGNLTPKQRDQIRTTLTENPELGTQFAAELEKHAKKIEVSPERRVQVGELVRDAAWKMRVQPPSLLIDGYREKVRKVEVRHGATAELQRTLIARMGQESFQAHKRRIEALRGATWDGETKARPSSAKGGGADDGLSDDFLVISAWTLGLSLITGVIGAATAEFGIGLFLLTVGVVGIAVGLVLLLIGLVLYGLED